MSAWSANSWFSTAWYSGAWLIQTVIVDTHDGEPERRRKHKEYQERRRQHIEQAFDAAFSNPETAQTAKEIASVYIPKATSQSVKQVDFSKFDLKPEHFDWLQTVLKKKQDKDEDELIMAYMATRH